MKQAEVSADAGSNISSEPVREAKQVLVIRRDLGMRRGKEIAQGAHASGAWLMRRLAPYEASGRPEAFFICVLGEAERAWIQGLFTKVVCQVPGEAELREVHAAALAAGIESHLITDAGKTEFGGVPTVTCVAVGPDWADAVDAVTGELKLY